MVYTKLKKLDDQITHDGKKWKFMYFYFSLSDARKFKDIQTSRYSLKCKIFAVPVSGNYTRAKTGYAVYHQV
jgi:hypothetical protein